MWDPIKLRLIEQLYEIGAIKFGEFQLKSSDISPVYIDLREIISYPKLLKEVSEIVSTITKSLQFDNICGVPKRKSSELRVVSVIADAPMILNRKEVKAYGTKKRIEGKYSSGQTSLIIEDVVTTGSSVLETAQALRAHGLNVKDAVVVFDREAGANEKLRAEGIHCTSILNISDIVAHLPADLDPTIRLKVEQYVSNSKPPAQPTIISSGESWSLERRRTALTHPTSMRLFDIMLKKKTNLCIAADMTDTASILQLARNVGSHICALKLHADIIKDFSASFSLALRMLSNELDFLIIEDRKFADTGNVVALQTGGIHQFGTWVDAFTVHGVSGPGVLEGLKTVCKNIGCFLVAQMSSERNLLDDNYQKATIQMASEFPDIVAGFICQKRVTENPRMLYLSPGVHLEKTTDNLGQQWRSPEDAISRDKVDIVIVGRGVIAAEDQKAAVEKYREASWMLLVQGSSETEDI